MRAMAQATAVIGILGFVVLMVWITGNASWGWALFLLLLTVD